MQNRTPGPANRGQPLPDFTPVARKYRHDGWTPERQRAFIAALADTGSVSRACALVNMSTMGAYFLRRQAGAESFRRAWEAALDFGVQRLKDLAFERAITGELVPVMSFGKLVGYRRKTNDRLLMFCLRMNARAPDGRRYSQTYFTPTAPRLTGNPSSLPHEGEVSRSDGGGLAPQPASLATPIHPTESEQLVPVGLDGQATQTADDQAHLIRHFDPVELSLPQIEALQALLAQAAEEHRARATAPEWDESLAFIPAADAPHALEPPVTEDETGGYHRGGETEIDWRRLDAQGLAEQAPIDQAIAALDARTPEEEEAAAQAITDDLRRSGQHAAADRMDAARAARRARERGA